MSHLFDSFRIGHFRGFTDVELADCGAVNLLIGANNSGKSSILEALALYARPFDQREWMEVLKRRDARSGRGVQVAELLWLFKQHPQFRIELSATGDVPIRHWAAEAKKVERMAPADPGNSEVESGSLEPRTGVQIKVDVAPSSFANLPSSQTFRFWSTGFAMWESSEFSIELHSLTPFSHRIDPLQLKGLSEATQQGWKEDILALLRQIDPAIDDLEILTPDGQTPALHVNYKGLGLAPLSTLGDGLRRIISIALAIGNLKNGLLLIDEIESAVHVSALETVFPWLTAACKKNNVQLFATTHSLEALDALLGPELGNDMVLYRLNRPDRPERVQRLAPDLVRRLRFDRGLDVRLGR